MPDQQHRAPLSIEEWLKLLDRNDLTDAEVLECVQSLRNFLSQFLDDYFREEFEPDDV